MSKVHHGRHFVKIIELYGRVEMEFAKFTIGSFVCDEFKIWV